MHKVSQGFAWLLSNTLGPVDADQKHDGKKQESRQQSHQQEEQEKQDEKDEFFIADMEPLPSLIEPAPQKFVINVLSPSFDAFVTRLTSQPAILLNEPVLDPWRASSYRYYLDLLIHFPRYFPFTPKEMDSMMQRFESLQMIQHIFGKQCATASIGHRGIGPFFSLMLSTL